MPLSIAQSAAGATGSALPKWISCSQHPLHAVGVLGAVASQANYVGSRYSLTQRRSFSMSIAVRAGRHGARTASSARNIRRVQTFGSLLSLFFFVCCVF